MDSDYQGSILSQNTFVPSCFISVGIFWILLQNFFSTVMIYLRKDPPLSNLDLQPASTTELVTHLQSAWNAPVMRLQSTLSSPGWANTTHFIVWLIASQFWCHLQGLQQLFWATVVFLDHREYSSDALLELDFLIEQKFVVPSPEQIDWLLQLKVVRHDLSKNRLLIKH